MEFKDEIIKKLADEGIVFTKNNTGSILTYRANYGHAEAKVFAGRSYQGFLPHFKIMGDDFKIMGDDMETVNKAFPEDADLEQVLRDVAEATGNMDQAIEDFQETIGSYTDLN